MATATATAAVNPLAVSPADYDFSGNPRLLTRILASPHGYFRFINKRFATETCRRFAGVSKRVPSVNLHGDAHLEQYAVTDLGRGLTDFDDSTTGPAVVDLMRFAVSLRLALAARGWEAHAEDLLGRFLAGYRAAMEDPETGAPEPEVAERIRAGFVYDRAKYFEWIESIAQPVPAEERAGVEAALAPYIETMCEQREDLAPGYFDIVTIGGLHMGIGSALDRKYLVRIEGPTDDPEDDVVLEVKEVRDLGGIPCIDSRGKVDPFRILVGQSRIAYEPYKLLGYIVLGGDMFWIHSWVDNYREVSIGETFASVEEVAEVVYDVGVQLGRGHPAQIAAPLGHQLRRAQRSMLDAHADDIVRASREMTAQTVAAWRRFKTELAAARADGPEDQTQP